MKAHKRVAVVGGGFSGLGIIKAFKEDNIEAVCYEKTSQIGGTWRYRTESENGIPSTMSTTVINHSKEMGANSNCPFPAEAPNYMRHHELYEHFMNMAKKFDVLKDVICNREVIRVEKAEDYDDTGRWVVTVKDTISGNTTSDIFDAVMLCVGQFGHPRMPTFPGMEKFRGRIMHSHSLKTFETFVGQRVVVVGTGCSALDAAVEISNVARQVYLSVRTPSWIMPRVGPYGLPFDYVMHRRYVAFIQSILPLSWSSKWLEHSFLNKNFSHKLYGIYPKYHFLSRDPIINDAIPSKLLSGSIVMRKNIATIEEDGVVFEGENLLTKVDTIIMATGYNWNFSFLEEGVLLEEEKGKLLLYKGIYPPHLKHPTLAFIGFILPIGPGFPIGELQTRWASYLLSGHGSLPSQEIMMADIERHYQENVSRYSPSDKMSQRVDSIPYMDDIASQFGVKPNFWKMAFTDPKLFRACIFGPSLPYQYRLEGPNKWDGAREAILTSQKRLRSPLSEYKARSKKKMSGKFLFHAAITISLLVFLLFWKSTSVKYYFLSIIIPYYLSVRGMFNRYLLGLILLPYFVPIQGFAFSYMITLFLPLVLALVTRF